jgi:hypothetical protein
MNSAGQASHLKKVLVKLLKSAILPSDCYLAEGTALFITASPWISISSRLDRSIRKCSLSS